MSTEKEIYLKMRSVKRWFYLFRNNPRNRDYFYNLLIESVGSDYWAVMDEYHKSSWEKARNSFDELYGLVKAWTEEGTKSDFFSGLKTEKVKHSKSVKEDIKKLKEDAMKLREKANYEKEKKKQEDNK